MRIEERKRVKGIVIDESRLTPEEKSWVKSGLDPECVRMLQDNFLARPKQALILSNPLPDIPQEVKKMYLQYRQSVHTRRPSALPEDFVRIFQLYDKSPELQNLFRDATPELKKISAIWSCIWSFRAGPK